MKPGVLLNGAGLPGMATFVLQMLKQPIIA
jgi:hypothetical protein